MSDSGASRSRALLVLLVAAVAALAVWWAQDTGDVNEESGLPVVQIDTLPPEAGQTLDLIESGGPFRYDRDGATFYNREELLPEHPEGYYQEYTVETPGVQDRGARRIVAGDGGEFYWTDDHYASFSRIAW